jgi:threonine dehydrogenase-like Zn-dependent dehydrogenase
VVADFPEPDPCEGEALVHVRVVGICDTDLQLARGYMGFRGVPGHEFVGVVADDGSDLAGRRVVADINAGCGACDDCRERDGHHCRSRTVLGIAGRPGALAERVAVPRTCLVEVPSGVPDDIAVFAEPLAAGLHVLDELPGGPSEPLVVLGDGKLGLVTTLALRAAGLDVHVVGHHPEKLALAARTGARTSLARDHDGPHEAAFVVDATGSPTGLTVALSRVRARGTIVLKTTVAGTHDVDLSGVVVDELRIVGSRCGDVARAMAELATGRIDPTPLVAARHPLREACAALEHAARRGVLKVLVDVAPQCAATGESALSE